LIDENETHLFRIAQEALTNVARHSGATRVQIRLTRKDDKVWLTVADNGRGLRISDGTTSTSIGMVGMRARARHAGGDFVVHSSDGTGLKVEVWVPAAVPSKGYAAEESPDSVSR
jgi:signal transduction histidine kinase